MLKCIWWLIRIFFVNIHAEFAHNYIHCVKINGPTVFDWTHVVNPGILISAGKNSSTPLAIPSVNAIWIVYNFRHVFSVILVKLIGQVLHIMQQVHLPLSSNIQMHKYVIWWTHRHTDRGWKVQLHSCFQGQRTSEREEKLFCLLQ